MTTEIDWIRNDTKFDQEFVLKDKRGNPVDLTGNSEVRFKMALPGAAVNKIDDTCTVTDAVNGAFTYDIADGDLDTAGVYEAEVQVTYASGRIISSKKITINVLSDLPA